LTNCQNTLNSISHSYRQICTIAQSQKIWSSAFKTHTHRPCPLALFHAHSSLPDLQYLCADISLLNALFTSLLKAQTLAKYNTFIYTW